MQPYKVNTERAKELKKQLQDEANRMPTWSPKEGRYVVRFLPPWSEAGEVGYKARWHWNLPIEPANMPCPHTVERECELCDYIKELRVRKHPKAQEMFAKRRIFYNIILREEEDKGPQLYASGIQVYEAVLAYLYDDEWGDITDIKTGRDMILERTGQGKEDTRYNLLPAPNPSPLHADQQTVDKWLSEIQNLDTALSYPEDADVLKIVAGVKQSIQLPNTQEMKQLDQPATSKVDEKVSAEKKELVDKLSAEIGTLMEGGKKL